MTQLEQLQQALEREDHAALDNLGVDTRLARQRAQVLQRELLVSWQAAFNRAVLEQVGLADKSAPKELVG